MSDSPGSLSQGDVIQNGKKFSCKHTNCGKFFRFKSEIERHRAIHSPSRPHKCLYENCSKTFKRSDALENHIRCFHLKEPRYMCHSPNCEMPFATRSSFQLHALTHGKQTSEESFNPDQSNSTQITNNKKLNSRTNHKSQINIEKDLSVPVILDSISNIQGQFTSEFSESTTEPSKIERAEKLETAEENTFLKEKLRSNTEVIKCLQQKINSLLSNFCTFHLEMKNKPEKEPIISDLSHSNDDFFQDFPTQSECKEERSSEIEDYDQGINLFAGILNIEYEISPSETFLGFNDTFEFRK